MFTLFVNMKTLCLLGQSLSKHDLVCLLGPVHACPSFWGGGLEQDRLLALVPDPHVLEQSSHVDHSVQRPFTEEKRGKERNSLMTFFANLRSEL